MLPLFDHEFYTLQANLFEIQQVLKDPRSYSTIPLIPYSKDQVIYRHCLLGNTVHVINYISSSFYSNEDPFPTIQKILSRALLLDFKVAIQEMLYIRRYRVVDDLKILESQLPESLKITTTEKQWKHLNAKEEGSLYSIDREWSLESFATMKNFTALSDYEVSRFRRKTLRFHQATYLFWRIFHEEGLENLKKKFCCYLTIPPDTLFMERFYYKSIEKSTARVILEGIIELPLPLIPLAKLILKMLLQKRTGLH